MDIGILSLDVGGITSTTTSVTLVGLGSAALAVAAVGLPGHMRCVYVYIGYWNLKSRRSSSQA